MSDQAVIQSPDTKETDTINELSDLLRQNELNRQFDDGAPKLNRQKITLENFKYNKMDMFSDFNKYHIDKIFFIFIILIFIILIYVQR